MRRAATIVSLILALGACRTTSEADSIVRANGENAAPPTNLPPPSPPRAAECPIPDAVCSTEYDPVVCLAESYRGRVLQAQRIVMAWGNNNCQGQLNLQREACARKMLPSALGKVQCVPDPSNGHCPPQSLPCPDETAASVCTAHAYGEQDLNGAQVLSGFGQGSCAATEVLQLEACRRNLDPALLRKITCGHDPTEGECSVVLPECEDQPRATVCTALVADGRRLEKPIEASGVSPCAAQQALSRKACSLNFRPSRLDRVVCQMGG